MTNDFSLAKILLMQNYGRMILISIYCIFTVYVFNTDNTQSYHPSWTSAKAPQTRVATNCPPTTSVLYETTKGPRSSIGAALEVFEIQKHSVKLGDVIFSDIGSLFVIITNDITMVNSGELYLRNVNKW